MKQARHLLILVLACLGSLALTAQDFVAVEVNATLSDDCTFTLTPSQVLSPDPDDDDDYTVIVEDNLANGAQIDGCGRWVYTVTGPGLNGRTWNYVNAEDKTAPTVVSTPDDRTLICSEFDLFNLTTLPASVSKCYRVERTGEPGAAFTLVNGTLATALEQRLDLNALDAPGVLNPVVATFQDGCTNLIEVCVNDRIRFIDAFEDGDGATCGTAVITRTFTATEIGVCPSASGEENPSTTASFEIFFVRPDLDDVEADLVTTLEIECDDPRVVSDDFSPADGEFPFVNISLDGVDRIFPLSGGILCNLAATFEDGPRIATGCDRGFKFIRTYSVIDWCQPDEVLTFTQIVKVGDTEAPTITEPDGLLSFATNAGNRCGAFIRLDGVVSIDDNCSPTVDLFANIYPGGDLDATPIGSFFVDNFDGDAEVSSFIPVGEHVIVYTAIDDCANQSQSAPIPFEVVDRTAPVAICEDGLNITLAATGSVTSTDGTGIAVITPANIDNGSYDDCTPIGYLIAWDEDQDGDYADDGYGQEVIFTCADLGTQQVSLLVFDRDGNRNTCWLDVEIEDKNVPICFAPDDVTITCIDFQRNLPNDISEATAEQLDALFGFASGIDDCEVTVAGEIEGEINSCGIGTFTRTFTTTDGVGFINTVPCVQTITVIGVHDYTIAFPQDAEGQCEVIPDYDEELDVTEFGCDLITTNVKVDTFRSLEAAEECFKLEVTYDVINWCEYNTLGSPYILQRDGNLDDFGGIARDPETEDLYLHVRPFGPFDGDCNDDDDDDDDMEDRDDDFAFLSRDADRTYTPVSADARRIDAPVDNGIDLPLDGNTIDDNLACYGTDDSRGFFRYVQFVKVYDDVAPTITAEEPADCFGGAGEECVAQVQLTFTATDECTDLTVNNLLVQLAPFYSSSAPFPNGALVVNSSVTDNGDGTFTINLADIPVGDHAIRIQARDGCGNFDVEIIEFSVCPDKAPTPICIQTLTVTLMPDGQGGGMAAIWASDFIASPVSDCFGNVINKYAIYRDDEAPATPDPTALGIDLTCDDFSEDTPDVLVRVYAIDDAGNADYCQVNIDVQAFQDGLCEDDGSTGALAGLIATQDDEMMSGVEVTLTGAGNMNERVVTGNTGAYSFEGLALGADYTIQPSYDAGVNLQDVRTSDIGAIIRDILGSETLTDAYSQIAADVNLDGQIDIFDVVKIRRVILDLDQGFDGGSFVFVRADFALDANNYSATFPEVYNINNLSNSFRAADFVAVQKGDVVRSTSGNGSSSLNLEDAKLEAGQVHTIALSTELAGFQGTLELAAGLELVDVRYGNMEAGNLNLNRAAEGLIGMSYNGQGAELLSIEVRATEAARLSDLVSLTDRVVVTEGVDARGNSLGLNLNFTGGVAEAANGLAQNTPNPVVENTRIDFTLAAAGQVNLTVSDLQGRVVLVRELAGAAGLNTTVVSVEELGAATGVLTYTLTAGDFTATKKMVVVR